ncbi:toll/interleukin-1 receptor domain-containing protein [Roseomonas sp. CECT 9278]|uniref:toll/interleukin-1 receptor domain-containing protein n=1 Tax=Roseomonas sp. CECT 9278 TaxID=2845823 RepID=UPI001E5DA6D8|nr:toll/interleukin-1 receptor domain-containing protein [Roseomonas sp. CECT 9278]
MPHDVFLSYASADRAAADAVCAALETRGIRCWIAPRDVPAGADWGEAILTAIGRAHAMVLVLSRHTAASVHVRNEVVTAVSQSLALVPVRIEDCQPGGALRLHLAGSHWLNVYPAPIDQHADALAGGVRLALAADATIEIPRAQAAAMVAAARASAGTDRPPPPPRQAHPPETRADPPTPRTAQPAQPPKAGATRAPHLPTPRRGLGVALAIGGLVVLCAAVAAAWYYEPRLKALFGATVAAEADTASMPAPAPGMLAAADPPAAAVPPVAAGEPPRGLTGAPGPLAGLGAVTPPMGLGAVPPPAAGFPAPEPASAPRSMTQAPPPRPLPPPRPAARVTNGATTAITQLFVARVEDGLGREDWLGHAQILPGNAVQLRAPAGQGCLFNIRVVYVGGLTEDRPGVDLCTAPDLRFEGSKGAGGFSLR